MSMTVKSYVWCKSFTPVSNWPFNVHRSPDSHRPIRKLGYLTWHQRTNQQSADLPEFPMQKYWWCQQWDRKLVPDVIHQFMSIDITYTLRNVPAFTRQLLCSDTVHIPLVPRHDCSCQYYLLNLRFLNVTSETWKRFVPYFHFRSLCWIPSVWLSPEGQPYCSGDFPIIISVKTRLLRSWYSWYVQG